jgi:hypothetical protein
MRQASRPLYWHSIAASRRPRIARKRNDQWAVVTTSPECDGGQISAARGALHISGRLIGRFAVPKPDRITDCIAGLGITV